MERVKGMLCIWSAFMASSGLGKEAMSTSSPVLLILPPLMSMAPISLSSCGTKFEEAHLVCVCVCVWSVECVCVWSVCVCVHT